MVIEFFISRSSSSLSQSCEAMYTRVKDKCRLESFVYQVHEALYPRVIVLCIPGSWSYISWGHQTLYPRVIDLCILGSWNSVAHGHWALYQFWPLLNSWQNLHIFLDILELRGENKNLSLGEIVLKIMSQKSTRSMGFVTKIRQRLLTLSFFVLFLDFYL